MVTLVVAYSVVWGGAAAYIGWLGIEQRRLSARIAQLEDQPEEKAPARPVSKAA